MFDLLLNLNTVAKTFQHYSKVHVHDSCLGMDLHLLPYQGSINWPSVSEALRDIGFSGVFSLETGAPQKLPTQLFEQMSIAIADIAKEIVK